MNTITSYINSQLIRFNFFLSKVSFRIVYIQVNHQNNQFLFLPIQREIQ